MTKSCFRIVMLGFFSLVLLTGCDIVLFHEDFEDANLSVPAPGWYGGIPGESLPVFTVFDEATNNYLLYMAPVPHISICHDLGDGDGIEPDYISFWVFPMQFYDADGWGYIDTGELSLWGWEPGDETSIHTVGIRFRFDGARPYLNGVWYYEPYLEWDPGIWYHVEFRDIDWDAAPRPTFNLYLNDMLVEAGSEIRGYPQTTAFTRICLTDDGVGSVYWDEILMVKEGPSLFSVFSRLPDAPQLPEAPPLPPELERTQIHTPTPTPTIHPTITLTPTITSLPIAEKPFITAKSNVTCREGSNAIFEPLGYLLEGERAEIVAVNPSHTWFWIQNPDGDGYCWVWEGAVEVSGDLDEVETRQDEPTPTPTPPVCHPDMSQDECEASGGTWSGAIGAPGCICP